MRSAHFCAMKIIFFFFLLIENTTPHIYPMCMCMCIYINSRSSSSSSSSSSSGGGGARAAFLLILSLFVRRRKSQRNSINYNLFYAYSILSSLFFLSLSLSLHPCSFSLFESYRLHLLLPRCEIFSRIASFHSVERLAVQLVQVPQRVDVFFVILVHDVFRNRVVSVRFLSNL